MIAHKISCFIRKYGLSSVDMDNTDVLRILEELRAQGSELQGYEAKRASHQLPRKVLRTISAFANQEDGGVVLLGVGDAPDFRIEGVEDVEGVQQQLCNVVQDCLSPIPELQVSSCIINEKALLVVKVKELPSGSKPCFDKREGLHGGAYRRVGDQDRPFSPYEIFLLQSHRTIPKEDIKPVQGVCFEEISDATRDRLRDYAHLVQSRTRSQYLLKLGFEELLQARKILIEDLLSLMGVLTFDDYPQRIFPKLRITFVAYGEDAEEQRYIDNKVFEGPLAEMLSDCLDYLLLQLPQGVFVRGTKNEMVPQIPKVALREALLNAVVHRDYSQMALGREVRVRLYPDRLEIENPGGLFGGLRIDSLFTHQSVCRNSHFATLLEDLGVMENRGDGILSILKSVKEVGLPIPVFQDKIDSFLVTFPRNQQATKSPRRTVEQFLEETASFARGDLMQALDLTVGEAKYELSKLQKDGKIQKHGRGRGTYYTPRS
jgi:ATP-dependent DNA helicase RecG